MITQQSFMFITSYEKMRKELLNRHAIQTVCHVGPRAFEAISGEKVNTTLFVLRREPSPTKRENAVGTYFRLVKEPDGESKQRRFEEAVARLNSAQDDPIVYRYRQGDFDAIPGSPWVYWITPGLRKSFKTLLSLGKLSKTHCGMTTSDNFRFLRFWWEVGTEFIGLAYATCGESIASEKRWFPYMKGGSFCRWYGNQSHVVNWAKDGEEIRAAPSFPRATQQYFRRGVTWTDLTSGRFSARLSPGGFIFDVSGSSVFPGDVHLVLGIMNSIFAQHVLNVINPTVHVQVGDLARLPIPKTSSTTLNSLVDQAIDLAKSNSAEDETTYDFIAPPDWRTGIQNLQERAKRLADIEREIDEEVYRLYGISDEDRKAIENELIKGGVANSDSEDAINELPPEAEDSKDLAKQWISYALGIVMGRFISMTECF